MKKSLLYADDLVPIAESEELLVEKIERWRKGLETRDVRPRGLASASRPLEAKILWPRPRGLYAKNSYETYKKKR